MNALIQEIIKLLTSAPGNLTYHLALAFAIAISLQAALNNWRSTQFPQGRRAVIGLSLLLLLRVALFVVGGIAWQGLLNEHILLPTVDRAVTLFSLIVIIWLWVFPEPSRLGDSATLLLALLAATMFGLNWTWWSQNGSEIAYNGSWPDFINTIAALFLLGCGSLLLLWRRPNSWGIGLGMLVAEAAGHILYLLLPTPAGDFAGIVRLAQMIAYPLLGFLPQRFPMPATSPQPASTPTQQERRRFGADPKLLDAYLTLSTETTPDKICSAITHTIAHTLLADLCLLVSPPNESDELTIQYGYDLIREEQVRGSVLHARLTPLLASSLGRGLPLRLPASSTSADLKNLSQNLNLERPGHLLSVPVLSPDGTPLMGIVLLSPYSNRAWNAEEQAILTNFARPLAQLLQRTQTMAALHSQMEKSNQQLQGQQDLVAASKSEVETLRSQLQTALEQLDKNRSQAESLAAIVASQEDTQTTLAHLQTENQRLQQTARSQVMLQELPQTKTDTGELRLALEEVARLQIELQEIGQKVDELASQPKENAAPAAQIEEIANIVQELRQPMSSILGYTDFLLGESIGILGTMQRKFLERVKMSTERMSKLVDDLVRVTSPGSDNWRSLPSDRIDLNQVLNDATALVSDLLHTRSVSMKMEAPDELPQLTLERESLQQALVNLIENAAEISPSGSEIILRARLEGDDHKQRYILLQITDQGGGIPVEYMPRVFSRFSQNDGKPIPGTAIKGANLSIVRVLVENVGGRIWVDSDPGVGSTFSILLPISTEPVLDALQAEEFDR